jgi:hypothetical protein
MISIQWIEAPLAVLGIFFLLGVIGIAVRACK